MKKILMVLFCVFILGGCQKTDSEKFKKEHESYNGQVNEYDQKYMEIKIDKDNPMVYADYTKIMEILDSSGVIYLGFPTCPWCRNALPVLLDVCKENHISKVYYLNNLEDRDICSLDENGNVVYEKEGTSEYYQLLKRLNDYALAYDGLENPEIKRIYFPTVIVVKDGKIILYHTSTLDSQLDPYIPLSEEQRKELYDIYDAAIKKLVQGCSIENKC